MKKTYWFTGLCAAVSAAAAFTAVKIISKCKKKKETEKPIEETIDLPLTDFSDREHLIFCEESDLKNRIIQLENTINMRDIGGYTGLKGKKTRWGKVIRSEDLSRLSDNDVRALNDMGVQHIYDFRGEHTATKIPDRLPESADYTIINVLEGVPLDARKFDFTQFGSDGPNHFLSQVYRYQVEHRTQVFVPILRAIGKDETPVLFHCTNGKDRTGFMTALILLICGVPEETIISDYSLTNLTFDRAYEIFGDRMAEDFGIPDKIYIRDFFGVYPAWIKITLDYIRENYENVDAYLLDKTDMTQEEIDKVREVMLEE